MKITSTKYISSSVTLAGCPNCSKPEFAFIGRSNVGKSSLINYLANHGSLSKVSKLPGKTKVINHFLINDRFYFVDLPGYGYAKVSKETRGVWGEFIEEFITKRENLKTVFILIDCSIEPQKIDLGFLSWVLCQRINCTIIFTKSDKESKGKIHSNIQGFKNQLAQEVFQYGELIPYDSVTNLDYLVVSSTKKDGSGKVLDYINNKMSH
jgi:GTP-binding protein